MANYLFLTEPDDSLTCVICLEVAKDPKQHEKCGKLFCSECIEKNGEKPCPHCRAKNPQYFMDMKSLREIRNLRVRCDNVERGCDWEGLVQMFDNHVTKCAFTLVFCPNKCKVEGEESQLMRKDLNDHLKTSCPSREYQCVHCLLKGTYASITEEHDSVCKMKVVPCPKTECTSTMERGQINKHIETVCKYTIVACKYVSIGCNMKKVRMDMKKHEEDDKSHLSLALEKIVNLEDTTSSLKATTLSLEVTMSSLKKNMLRDKSIFFSLLGFSKMKEHDGIFNSQPIYSSPGGYKVLIKVYPNGFRARKGTHVSIYSQLLEGPYDGNLPWPFLGIVTVELLNQLADDNHHRINISYKTTDNARVGNIWGCSTFLSHSKLSHDQASNTQYLMADTLYFRVTVEVDHNKPWLHCSNPTK